jgi:tetratricopeptide (TPR) repeat protein
LATSLNKLAALYKAQGKYAAAEPLFKRSLAIREQALGPEHPEVAASLQSYAALLRKMDRAAEAQPMEARAMAIRDKPAKHSVTQKRSGVN